MNHNANVSTLAKLLATENINIVEDASAKTASFDLVSRTLSLPLWEGVSRDMVDMLVVHETGHAIDTPSEDYPAAIEEIVEKVFGDNYNNLHRKAVAGFLNIIEDVRVDKRQKRRYPGAKYNYAKAGQELLDRDFFGLVKNKKNISELILIDRLNIYSKAGVRSGVTFNPEEEILVNKAYATEKFDEVKVVVEEFLRACQTELQKKLDDISDISDISDINVAAGGEVGDEVDGQPGITVKVNIPNIPGEEKSEKESDENPVKGDKSDAGGEVGKGDESDAGDEAGKGDKSDAGDEAGKGDKSDAGDEAGNDKGHGSENASIVIDVIPLSETLEEYEQALEAIANPSNKKISHCTLPTPIIENIVEDYKSFLRDYRFAGYDKNPSDFVEWKKSEKLTVSYLVQQFELKKAADQYSKVSVNKTGVINTNKIYSYKYNEDIFRRNTVLPKGKNHGFVMFLDWSSSMAANIKATIKQLLSLVLFCKQIQVPFEVYLFKNGVGSSIPLWKTNPNENVLLMDEAFRLRNILSSRMSTVEFNEAMGYVWGMGSWGGPDKMNCTPLNSAILAAEPVVNAFKAKTKVEIVNVVFLTDGDSDPCYLSGGLDYNTNLVIHDNKTKERYVTDNHWRETTENLLKILKVRTGCNLIGFFLIPDHNNNRGRRYRNAIYHVTYQYPEAERNKYSKQFEDEKYVELTTTGYDSYYLVAITNNGKEELGDIKTKAGKINAKAFGKFMKNKLINRALLRKFVDNISKKN